MVIIDHSAVESSVTITTEFILARMNAGPQQLTTNTITLELVQTLTSNLFL